MFAVELLVAEGGECPFQAWFDELPASVADRVDTAVERMRRGNLGDHKGWEKASASTGSISVPGTGSTSDATATG